MKKKILIVDDEVLIREFIVNFFQSIPAYGNCLLETAANGDEAIAKIKQKKYDLIFTDLKMPGKSGLDVIKFVSENSPTTDTVLITAYGAGDSAAKAMAYGAYEYITKPVLIDDLDLIVRHIFERQDLIFENERMKKNLAYENSFPKIIGKSKPITDVMDLIKMVAPTNTTILITGESGTGKELVAEAIHTLSKRKNEKYIKINCAALPEHLIESELFGFEKGAFTGAIKRTIGKFELSNKGSILLDEISEMNLDLQAKLLRVIQEKEFSRIGGELPIKVDTRIIATSNRDLTEEIAKGTFREDLFFRLSIVPIRIPPLRERKEDIPLLINSFIKKLCFEMGIPKKTISSDAIDSLMEYKWPGNIRELQNAVERALITTRNEVMTVDSFNFIAGKRKSSSIRITNNLERKPDLSEGRYLINIKDRTLADIEKEVIYKALDETNNNKTEAAKKLGVTARTLRNKLKIYEEE
jgi:DNA-binding NtrC family response regulator